MKHLGLRSVATLALAAIASLTLGLLFSASWGWAFFSLVAVSLLAFHLRQLKQLTDWLAKPETAPVPNGSGVWEEVFTSIHRRRRDQIRRRGRFARLLARSMQAGRALPYGVTVLDADLRIVWCNHSAEQIGRAHV